MRSERQAPVSPEDEVAVGCSESIGTDPVRLGQAVSNTGPADSMTYGKLRGRFSTLAQPHAAAAAPLVIGLPPSHRCVRQETSLESMPTLGRLSLA